MAANLPLRPGRINPRSSNISNSSRRHEESQSESDVEPGVMTPPEQRTIIDPRGDLLLHVNNPSTGEHTFLISSVCFRLASTKWCDRLDALPTGNNGDSMIEFEENVSIQVLTILLRIAHSQFAQIPDYLSWRKLCQLADVCEAHGTAELVLPFLREWTSPWISRQKDRNFTGWLHVAYVFGYKNILEDVTLHWAFWSDADFAMIALHLNSRILLNVKRVRRRLLTNMLEVCSEYVDRLSGRRHYGHTHVCQHECASVGLGSLLRGLQALSLWPQRPAAEDTYMSVVDMKDQLLNIEILRSPLHNNCEVNEQFHASVEAAAIAFDNPLTMAFETYFSRFHSGSRHRGALQIQPGRQTNG